MAWLSDLVRVLAEVTGIPEPTVAQIARHVREEGFISSGGRGKSAAKMTADDCANLLIAVMVADQAKNAPEYVKTARLLKRMRPANDIPEIGDTFSSALSNLLKSLSANEFQSVNHIEHGDLDVSVSVNRPLTHGHISLSLGRSGEIRKSLFHGSYFMGSDELMNDDDPISLLRFNPPFSIEATVNELVVLSLSDLLKT